VTSKVWWGENKHFGEKRGKKKGDSHKICGRTVLTAEGNVGRIPNTGGKKNTGEVASLKLTSGEVVKPKKRGGGGNRKYSPINSPATEENIKLL